MALKLITPATVLPVSLAQAKAQCRVDGDWENDQLELYIRAAIEEGENLTNRAFAVSTWELVLDNFPAARAIELPRPPLQSVSSVKYLDTNRIEQTLAPTTGYLVDTDREPGRIHLPRDASWPSTHEEPNAVRIRYLSGWPLDSNNQPTTPRAIQQWLLLRVAGMYEFREPAVEGHVVNELSHSHMRGLLDRYTILSVV